MLRAFPIVAFLTIAHIQTSVAGECSKWTWEPGLQPGQISAEVCIPKPADKWGNDMSIFLYISCYRHPFYRHPLLSITYRDLSDGFALNNRDGSIFSFVFETEKGKTTAQFEFNGESGNAVGEVPFDSTLVALLKGSQSVAVNLAGRNEPPVIFSLEGSAAALTAVAPTCRGQN